MPSFGGKIFEEKETDEEEKAGTTKAPINTEESNDPNWFEKVYPFKADDFGQLVLPENVITAKLVSLNNYGATLPMALITSNRGRHH